MKTILTGIQPSGALHLGNYFGAIQPAVELAKQGQAVYFIADYHALTSVTKPDQLRRFTFDAAAAFLACGIEPERTILFRQSDVPQVHELAWLLSVITPLGLLERATSYKDKVAQGAETTHGLFAYPVLMAIDILIYQSNIVPVGRDQKQHVEMTRDLALKFNRTYGETFTIPEPSILPGVEVIRGLDGQKMSKSYDNTIELFAEEKALRKKVMSIVTDSTPVEAPKDPANSAIVDLFRLFAPEDAVANMENRFRAGGVGYGEFKKELFEAIWSYFEPMRKRRKELEIDPDYVDLVLAKGAERANALAYETVSKVRQATGLH